MLETVDINGVEFFAVGSWNGEDFNEGQLDEMVRSYEATKNEYVPFLKISHDDSQELAKRSGLSVSELPALGIVENVRRVGSKLIADFKKVPKKIAELMKVGAYRTRSAEIWSNVDWAGGKLPLMLKAISILGAEAPAVAGLNTLDDIIALYKGSAAAQAFNGNAEAKSYNMDLPAHNSKEVIVTEQEAKALTDKVAALEAQAVEVQKNFTAKAAELEASIKAQTERAEKAEAGLKKYSEEKRDLEISGKVDELIRTGKLAPAQKEFAVTLLKSGLAAGELKFAHGDKEYKSPEEILFALIDSGAGVTLPTETKTGAGEANRESKDGVTGEDLDRKIREYMEKNKGVSYREAFVKVSGDQKSK